MKGNRWTRLFLFGLILAVSFGDVGKISSLLPCMRQEKTIVRAAEVDSMGEETSDPKYTENIENQETDSIIPAASEEKTDSEEELGEVDVDGSSLKPIYDEETESTVYSCIYYGSYPQTQVTGDELTSTITDAKYDENGDATIRGNKYHKVDNIFGVSYFLYEPIKWKIIANPDGYIVAMAEKGLDYCSYYEAMESAEESTVDVQDLSDEELENYTAARVAYDEVSWEESTIRSWLNSYGEKKNIARKNYKDEGDGFFNTAFSEIEQEDINEIEKLSESEFISYLSIAKGDRVALLNSEGVLNENYGFKGRKSASTGRILEKTDYAAERGKELNDKFSDENAWWVASSSESGDSIQYVNKNGAVKPKGTNSYHSMLARPVIVINEKSENIKDAGQVAVSNTSGDSITVQLKADTHATLNEQRDGYKDATIEIFVKNIGSEPVQMIDAVLEFDDGEKILDGENSIHFSNIDAGDKKNIAWKFAIKPQKKRVIATYTIKIVGKNLAETCIKSEIDIPRVVVVDEQDDSGEEEASTEQENKTFLEKLRDFFKGLS